MKREKFLHDAKLDPSRYYRNPADVVRDRRLSNEDRLQILDAWAREIDDDGEMMRQEIQRVREQVANGTTDFAAPRLRALN